MVPFETSDLKGTGCDNCNRWFLTKTILKRHLSFQEHFSFVFHFVLSAYFTYLTNCLQAPPACEPHRLFRNLCLKPLPCTLLENTFKFPYPCLLFGDHD